MSLTTGEELKLGAGSSILNTDYVFQSFYNEKSIVESYNFGVNFISGENSYANGTSFTLGKHIKPWHIVSVDIPTTRLQRESTNYGVFQFSYPVLSKEQPYDIKMVLEEDARGTITELIGMLYDTVVDNGLYNPIKNMRRLGKIIVVLYDTKKQPVMAWEYTNCFFLGAENLNYSFEESGAMRYTVTFGSDTCTIIRDDKMRSFIVQQEQALKFQAHKTGFESGRKAIDKLNKKTPDRSTLIGRVFGGITS